MVANTNILSPTISTKRVISIDILRGIALLGILAVTIQSYAMPASAMVNPTSYEKLSGIDLYVWLISHILGQGKFVDIFSMMFGASIIMLSHKARKEHLRSSELQYRRLFWLLVIGLLHAYLIWYRDILSAFAICGFLMFMLRSKKKENLLRIGLLLFALGSISYLVFGFIISRWEPEQFETLRSEIWHPNRESISEEIGFYTSVWERQMLKRFPDAFQRQTYTFLFTTFWRVSGLMLIGMFFYKKGVFTLKQSRKFYGKMIVYGLGIGLPLVVVGVILDFKDGWDFEKSYFYYSQLNYWGSLLMAIGYMGVILMLCKISTRGFIPKRIAQVGQMSLTNYILQSIICSYIFYGHGLGLFGDLDRSAQAVVVFGLWIFLILFSAIWLKIFRFGPMEWIWRSLSYGRFLPIRKPS